jgi:AcrR family transcriptional regulator
MSSSEHPPQTIIARKRGRPPRDVGGILEAAITVFAREGYSAATIEMIAAESSASTATLYKRFTNKHGLFVAVLQQTTIRSLAIHTKNRSEPEHPFSSVLNRLEAHALVSSDAQVRGVMRAWISEVRSHAELRDLFAVNSGKELVTGLINQLRKLEDAGLVAFNSDDQQTYVLAAQIMLGIIERFTLMRGLILGDTIPPIFSARGLAEKAVHAVIGIWGTPAGIEAYGAIPKTNITYEAPL